jgi:hypothetical protein
LKRRAPLLLAFLLMAAACSNGSVPEAAAAASLPIETLLQQSNPGQSGPARREVIRDQETWNRVWAELREGSSLPAEPPAVDFERDMVILAAMETQGCVSRVTIRGVARHGQDLIVDLLEAPPAPNCVCIVSERPFHLVRLQQSELPVRFEAEQGRTEC